MPKPDYARKNEAHAAVVHYFLVWFPADLACLRRLASVSFIRFKAALCLEDLAKLVYSLGSLSRTYNSAASAAPHSA